MFLLFKLMYEAEVATISQLLMGFAIMTSVIWVKTFFFVPYETVNLDVSTFKSSIITSCCKNQVLDELESEKPKLSEKSNDVEKEIKEITGPSLKSCLLSWNYLWASLFFIIMTVRINSFPSWYLPWLSWTFSGLDEQVAEDNKSLCIDIYGYSYYISLFISPLPGFIITTIKKITNNSIKG